MRKTLVNWNTMLLKIDLYGVIQITTCFKSIIINNFVKANG